MPTAVVHSLSRDETLTQTERAAGNISTTPHNEPSNIADGQARADSCDNPTQDGQDEPDYGQIVKDLQMLKGKQKRQKQKIEAGRGRLLDLSLLTQSASQAQRAADEAQRAADEAQRVADDARRAAETTNKAVDDARAQQRQLDADELHLEKLVQDIDALWPQLGIDLKGD